MKMQEKKDGKGIKNALGIGILGLGGISLFSITINLPSCGGMESRIKEESINDNNNGNESKTPTSIGGEIGNAGRDTEGGNEGEGMTIQGGDETGNTDGSTKADNDTEEKIYISGDKIEGAFWIEGQKEVFYYIPEISGIYRFDFGGSDRQCDYKFYVYSSINEEIAFSRYSNEGKTIELEEDVEYRVEVAQDDGMLDYDITINVPNEIKIIETNYFDGEITYIDQVDRYEVIIPRDGVYRFDFETDNVETIYRFKLFADNNEQLASSSSTNEGKTIELKAGEKYRIEIHQYSGFEEYRVDIGIPKEERWIEGNFLGDTLIYTDQEDVYKYIAPLSGEYTFWFGTNDVTSNYRFYIYSPINEQLVSGSSQNEHRKVELKEGEEYRIVIKQNTGYPEYRITIELPK